MKKILNVNKELINDIISKGYGKRDFCNLLDLWKKIRDNFPKFSINLNVSVLIEDIDKTIENMEIKIENKEEEKNKLNQNKNSPLINIKNEIQKKEIFSKDDLLNENMDMDKTKNNLENKMFHFCEEKLGENIFEINKNNQNIINYIEIDLFLQRIALGKNIYDDVDMENKVLKGFFLQHIAFITTEVLISKIISCFNYFYSEYIKKDKEPKLNNKNIDMFVRLRNKYGNRSLNTKEVSNKNILNRNSERIPYNIINLLISFVDLHDKYCNSTITHEIIKKIQNFYQSILGINQIKAKYGNELLISIDILKKMRNSTILKRTRLLNNKLPFEKIFPKKILVKDLLRNEDNPTSYFNILDFDSKEIAAELTYISYKLYSKLETKEFLKAVFTKKNKDKTSPNIAEIYNRFNKVSFWCIEEILMYDKKRYRANIIEKFIDIINELIILNNFFDSMSLSSALSQIIVNNLNKTWKCVSQKSIEIYQQTKKFLSFDYNYEKIRDKINDCVINDKPYIPFLSPYSKTLCYLEEYGPYVKENSLINVDKIVLVQQIFEQLFKFKLNKYNQINTKKNELLILHYLDPASEEELEHLASLLEPKFTLSDEKQKEKRASNTEKNFKKIMKIIKIKDCIVLK